MQASPKTLVFYAFIYQYKALLIINYNIMFARLTDIFKQVWLIESTKYKRIGPKNALIGFFILYLYFFRLTEYVKSIWPSHIEDKVMFQVIVSGIVYAVSTPLCFLQYAPGYFGMELYKKYEVEPDRKWPWQLDNWNQLKWTTLWNLLLNNLVVFPLYIYTGLKLAGSKMRFDNFPTPFEMIQSFLILMVVDDFVFMCFHGMFHKVPFLYRFHKIHHEYSSVFSGIGQYAHPFELVMGMSVLCILFSSLPQLLSPFTTCISSPWSFG